jgi:hypothetical protein
MNAYVGMLHAGVCALAFGICVIDAAIEAAKVAMIKIATILFSNLFILFFSMIL